MSKLPTSLAKPKAAGAAVAVSMPPVFFAQRDLRRRASRDVREPKLAWRLLSTNALGALAYLILGRR